MRFRVEPSDGVDRWEIRTFAYSYLVFVDDLEVFAYHWNHEATGARAVRNPHMHLGKDLAHSGLPSDDRARLAALAAAHLPTGLIPFTAILRTAIRDLGVVPIREQGESEADARARAERSFEEAEAALLASFAWWKP